MRQYVAASIAGRRKLTSDRVGGASMPRTPMLPNGLLAALPAKQRALMIPHLRPVGLNFEQVLYEPGEPIRSVFFPTSGMISLLVILSDGSTAEVDRIGSEGMIGLPIFLGVRSSHTRAIVQVAGEALRMRASVFRHEVGRSASLSALMRRYTQALMQHTSQLIACNSRHSIEQRLCRWLIVTYDRVRSDRYHFTQEFLARMLGTHRESITLAANNLRQRGLIQYSRGTLVIVDRQGLEAASCECYRAVSRTFDWLNEREAMR
jgi:CRP-like cAMP-binding protein